ncbi:fumarylacetoacetate hydrolase family protein [Halorhodospira halochloris]|uniref:Fumarylacetoacetate hydrolase family protein n=1 Tax=Halorhodospira halochloris TaxID=1052 RepID=A0A0X8X8K6_HALHR|nr:fumarylacetoacetate hydrolase family protein [Halorhodospira halochloris]MBK1651194.1 5-carboxymethyl-2-hydroxymuconate isomerase [Halorhodospira halochloris]MCG5547661.1 fumarylacetoacetate hydrolase family protein [Halorhodospira halochloris]BAU57466.1 fumarylacetoacetate hydrolase family protein [Halorhodospira halochloris]
MRITTVSYRNKHHIAIQESDSCWAVSPQPANLGDALATGEVETLLEQSDSWSRAGLDELAFLAPIPYPRRNIICLGMNYAEHAEESLRAKGRELELPEYPVLFTKATTAVIGPYSDIVLDEQVTQQLDWEVELALIIGKGGRYIAKERAFDHIFGYTVVNDLSARDLQFRHKQFFLGKSMDGSCPMGPWITTADQLHDPHNLTVRSYVNDQLKQDGNTRDMVFRIPEIIATLANVMTLQAGDIIATGTPSGVGFARQPPEYLQPGDITRCYIEGLGEIANRIVSA